MNAKFRSVVYGFLVNLMLTNVVRGRFCDVFFGPRGQSKCLLYERGNGVYLPQWTTCVSKVFILRTSTGRVSCKKEFCFSDCMREFHDIQEGRYALFKDPTVIIPDNMTMINISASNVK